MLNFKFIVSFVSAFLYFGFLCNISPAMGKNKKDSEMPFSPYKRIYGTFRLDDAEGKREQIKLHGGFKAKIIDRFELEKKIEPLEFIKKTCGDFFFSYSMIALWNIQNESGPFEDINHNPEAFCQNKFGFLEKIQFGYEHLSNGVSNESVGPDGRTNRSRSIHNVNTILKLSLSEKLTISPKVWWNFAKDENKDIDDFWGNIDLGISYRTNPESTPERGATKGFVITTKLRGSFSTGKGRIEFDISHPVPVLKNAYWFFQIFSGYGETILDYDNKITAYRFGFQLFRF